MTGPCDEMYAIDFDRKSGILRLRLVGFWNEEVMRRFVGELTAVVERLRHDRPDFAIFSDCLDYPVQSAEIGAAWARLLGPDTAISAPYAVVVGSMINKLQAERALTAENVKIFTAREAASAWLAERLAGDAAAGSKPAG